MESEKSLRMQLQEEKNTLLSTIHSQSLQSYNMTTTHTRSHTNTSSNNNNTTSNNTSTSQNSYNDNNTNTLLNTSELAQKISDEIAFRLKPEYNNIQSQLNVKDMATDKLCQMLLTQVEQLRNGLDATESKAQYWQQVAQKVSSISVTNSMTAAANLQNMIPPTTNVNITATDGSNTNTNANTNTNTTMLISVKDYTLEVIEKSRLKDENTILKDQLVIAKSEAHTAKTELRDSQQHMQQEFASLWLAVQELNKIDSDKEKALMDLIEERNKALRVSFRYIYICYEFYIICYIYHFFLIHTPIYTNYLSIYLYNL